MRILRRAALSAPGSIALAVALAGCSSAEMDLEGRDNSPVQASARIVAPLSSARRRAEEGGAPVRPGVQLEITGDHASGDFHLEPAGTRTDYSMWQVAIAPRWGVGVEDALDLDLLAGLAYHAIDLDVEGGSAQDRDEDGLGPIIGAEVAWRPVDRLALYGRATGVLLFGGDLATSGQAEAGLRLELFRGLHAFGGYRHWRYNQEEVEELGPEVDIDLKVNGFVFGGELRF